MKTPDFITIVSGLPRSGTSLMMQMLDAGGLEPLKDDIRTPDIDNPRGYYEFEPVKKTMQDPSWLKNAPGKAVKMVYRLLYDLPAGHKYRVIFMRRDLAEVLASQKKMLQRLGKKGGDISDDKMAELFEAQLAEFDEWVKNRGEFSVLHIRYKDLIEAPAENCRKIRDFLTLELDIEAMAACVDPSLYRNKR